MANAIIIAIVAGLASALLAAAAIAGPGIGLICTAIAPLPLMIVAIGWQPLMAVLGGALTSAALAFFFRGSTGVVFAVLVTLPAYLAGSIIWRGGLSGRAMVGILCLGAAAYGAFATLIGALSISTDYATLEAALLRQSDAVYRFMMGIGRDAPLDPVNGQDPQIFIRAYANAVAPLSAAMLAMIYMLNIWLASKIAHRSNPGNAPLPTVWTMQLPKLLLPFAALAMLGGMLPGYPGLTLELLGTVSIVCLIALGYAAVHHVTIGSSARWIILTGLWLLTFVFGIPVLLMLVAGIAELAFGWRDKIIASRNS